MFNEKLESLRGLAALAVAVHHCFLIFAVDQNQAIWDGTLSDVTGVNSFLARMTLVIFNGGAAVSVFFVLSGYVLGLSLDRKPGNLSTYHAFYIKRVFRIYPAYFVSLTLIILSIILFHKYIRFPNTSVWFNWWYTEGISLKYALENYFLVDTDINNVAWTLKVELLISLIFPVIYLLNRWFGLKMNLLFLLGLIILGYLSPTIPTLQYTFMFYIGLMLPLFIKKEQTTDTSSFRGNVSFLISLTCLLSAKLFLSKIDVFVPVLVQGIAAGLLIWILLNVEGDTFFNRILKHNLARKLGKYSYSFYLYHFIVMYWSVYGILLIIQPEISAAYPIALSSLIALVSIPISYFLAILSYEYVEAPMLRQGSLVAEKYSVVSRRVFVRGTVVILRWRKRAEALPLAIAFRRSR
jgi:peptidoglycan/LPS O-acetylase OafA/YrhL